MQFVMGLILPKIPLYEAQLCTTWRFDFFPSDYVGDLIICFLYFLLQVEQNLHRFDASRSTGHLCAATANNLEQVISTVCAVTDKTFYFLVTKLLFQCVTVSVLVSSVHMRSRKPRLFNSTTILGWLLN